MKKIYVAGAYRDARGAYYIKRNIDRAEKLALYLMREGHAVFCPHKNTGLLDGALPDDYFLESDIVWLRTCDEMAVLQTRTDPPPAPRPYYATYAYKKPTSGVREEMKVAMEMGIPISFYEIIGGEVR